MEAPVPASCKTDVVHDPERIPSFAEGMAIARDEYRSRYGRDIGASVIANPEYAATLIENDDHHDVENDVWYSTYDRPGRVPGGPPASRRFPPRSRPPTRLGWQGQAHPETAPRATHEPV